LRAPTILTAIIAIRHDLLSFLGARVALRRAGHGWRCRGVSQVERATERRHSSSESR
jgi:hypothetical protein